MLSRTTKTTLGILVGAVVVAGGVVGYKVLRKTNPPPPGGGITPPAAPGAVTGIAASNVTIDSMTLSWNAVAGASFYELLHTDATGNPATTPITVNGQSGNDFHIQGTSVQITDLVPGESLYFEIRAALVY